MGDRHERGLTITGPQPGPLAAAVLAAGPPVVVAEPPVEDILGTDAAPVTATPGWRPRLTVEQGVYALLIILAALTRFWDLGSRTLHHDESLHTYYSWLYTTGQGYVHDPLMHGPFLFHAVGLAYLLLGDSEVTSRLMPVLFGVALVWLPYLLRGPRFLGQWGALAASALILISPALLYQSRYLRHDMFTLTGTLLLFIAIVRYVEKPERRWLITIGITLPCLIANHEIIFGLLAVFVGMLGLALLWGRLRPITPVVIVTGAAFLASWLILPRLLGVTLPDIPWENPTRDNQLTFYREFLTYPALIVSVLALIAGVAAAGLILRRRPGAPRGAVLAGDGIVPTAGDDAGDGTALTPNPALTIGSGEPVPDHAPKVGLVPSLFGSSRFGTVEAAVYHLWLDRTGFNWMIGLTIGISVVLFTSLFTNLYGLATATIATDGTLLYWLGQHDYRRGEQPWFYYLLLLPQYEFIAVLLGLAAAVVIAVRSVRVGLGRIAPGSRFFFQLFLLAWFAGILGGLSWAGEKMPWLMTHITLPATLLAAALIG
ncbi:MAG: TIGR03663 family protein, partial [Chloroflexota bacterium]|nr:TIGR03663 family protein [Chloroflexota bacterium]